MAGTWSARTVSVVLVAAALAAGCAETRLPFIADVPPSNQPEATAAARYPNLNRMPDRPARALSPAEVRQLEQELEAVGRSHVGSTTSALERR